MVKFSLQIIKNTPTPSIVCTYENSRYIFNTPDGFQRFYREHKVKITPSTNFFFTRNTTQTTNGLFGFIQTLIQENNAIGSKIYGPKGIALLMNVMRYNDVGGYKTYPYSIQEFNNGQLVLGTKDLSYLGDILGKQNDCLLQVELEKLKEMQFDANDSNNASKYLTNPNTYKDGNLTIIAIPIQNTIQYIIQSYKQTGGISKEKLKQFQVPSNQMKDFMKKGTITLQDGTIISLEQVKDKDILPQVSLILDLHSVQQLTEFQKSIEFQQILEDDLNKKLEINCIFHLSTLVNDDEYTLFILQLPQYKHILCCYEQISQSSIQQNHSKFQLTCENICNQLHAQYPFNFPFIEYQKLLQMNEQLSYLANVFGYIPLYEFNLLPYKQNGLAPLINSDIPQIQQFQQQQQQLQQELDDKRLIFLGTSSMKPGKFRNVSGIIINSSDPVSNIILDCGESTWKQIMDQDLQLIDQPLLIWISHAHSDHHMGLLTILDELKDSTAPIYVILPATMVPWIYYYHIIIEGNKEFELKHNFKIIVSQQFEEIQNIQELVKEQFYNQRIRYGPQINVQPNIDFNQNYLDLISIQQKSFGLSNIKVAQVEHCPQAYGLRLEFNDGRILSYSGDTRPCESFIGLSKKASIMIHEATFTDDLQQNALTNMHSTIGEAIKVGLDSESEISVLTHFSQRYAKKVELTKEQLENDSVVYAMDHLGGYFRDYKKMSQLSKDLMQIIENVDE